MDMQPTTISDYNVALSDRRIEGIYSTLRDLKILKCNERLAFLSQQFLDCSYLAGACGEGKRGMFDQSPLYRFDAFDCVTYVNTVIALSLADDLAGFKKNLVGINYRDGKLAFQNRHHFMSVDWNAANKELGVVEDVTSQLFADDESALCYTRTLIDRPGWFLRRELSDIKLLQPISLLQQMELLESLRSFSKSVKRQESVLPFAPLSGFFDQDDVPNFSRLARIPHAAVIEIVRPNWEMADTIGTNLDVSHCGFAIWVDDKLRFRHASTVDKRVVEVSLVEYLRNQLPSRTVKGINIQRVKERDIK